MSDVTREEFNSLKKEFESFKKSNKMGKAPKKTRAPSEFNIFVGKEIKSIKAGDKDIKHTDAFKQAVDNWKVHKESLVKST